MDNLFDLLKCLYAIRFFAKDIHYKAKGENFWPDHIFADEIFDGIDDLIDQVNENLYLGFNQEAPASKEILKDLIDFIPDITDDMRGNWERLAFKIDECISTIKTIEDEYDLPQLNALLDTIANDMQKRKGLIWRRTL